MPAFRGSNLDFVGFRFGLSGRLLVGEQVARLAVENFAKSLERAEADGSGPAGLEHREILRGDAHLLSERVESHFAAREHDVQIDDNGHFVSLEIVKP
jgi:hypothetical protein